MCLLSYESMKCQRANGAQETPLSVVKEKNEECYVLCSRHHLIVAFWLKLVFYQLFCNEVHLCDIKLILGTV